MESRLDYLKKYDGETFLVLGDEAAASARRRELEETEARHATDLDDGTYFFSKPPLGRG